MVQVVKAFIVLAPAFVSHDPEKLTQDLQQHVKKVTAPYKYPRKVSTLQKGLLIVSGTELFFSILSSFSTAD